MLRILFINPPYARFMGTGHSQFPLPFGNMATMLSEKGHHVGIYDADFDTDLQGKRLTYHDSILKQKLIYESLEGKGEYVWNEVKEIIRKFTPDIIGITSMTNKFPMVLRIAQIAKSINPSINIIIGGHHPTIYGGSLLKDNCFDFAVAGEGELTVCELIDNLAARKDNFNEINGLIYKEGSRIITNPARSLIEDLDTLPMANRDLVINQNYVSDNNIMTTRGCPYNCSYCGSKIMWKRRVRRRSIDNILTEIKYLLERNPSRGISFWDDSFTNNHKYIHDLMAELKKNGPIKFNCITRLDLVNPEVLRDLKQGGCEYILLGIESGSDRILDAMHKKMDRKFIKQKIDLIDSFKINWLGFFIMGYPGETKEDIFSTLDFMKDLNPAYAEINIFNPLPCTEIWDKLKMDGHIEKEPDFLTYSQASTDKNFLSEKMSGDEFEKLAIYVAKEFDKHNLKQRYGFKRLWRKLSSAGKGFKLHRFQG